MPKGFLKAQVLSAGRRMGSFRRLAFGVGGSAVNTTDHLVVHSVPPVADEGAGRPQACTVQLCGRHAA